MIIEKRTIFVIGLVLLLITGILFPLNVATGQIITEFDDGESIDVLIDPVTGTRTPIISLPIGSQVDFASFNLSSQGSGIAPLPSDQIYSVTIGNDIVYVGTAFHGVSRFNLTSGNFEETWTTSSSELSANTIRAITVEDHMSRLPRTHRLSS